MSNSSLTSYPYPYPYSIGDIQSVNSYEQSSVAKNNLTNCNQYSRLRASLTEPSLEANALSDWKAGRQQRSVSSFHLTTDDQEFSYISLQHQSSPNIFYSNQAINQQSRYPQKQFQPENFIRSANQTSFITQYISRPISAVFQEDVSPNQYISQLKKPIIPPKLLPKPMINIFSMMKRPSSVSYYHKKTN